MDFSTKDKLYQFAPITTEKEKTAEEQSAREFDNRVEVKQDQKLQDQEKDMSFSSMVQLYSSQIEQKNYSYKDGSSTKKASRVVRPNSSMSKVIGGLQSINSLLDSSMGQVDFKDEQSILAAQKPFLDLCAACRTYLKNHRKKPWTAEGRARRQMVEDILRQAEKESMALYQRLKSYGEGDNPDIPKPDKWKDVLEDIRTEEVKGKAVELGGSGTSKLEVVEVTNKSGETETKYFKESEDMPSIIYALNVQKEVDKLNAEKEGNTSETKQAEIQKIKEMLNHIVNAMNRLDEPGLNALFSKGNTPALFMELIKKNLKKSTLDDLNRIDTKSELYNRLVDIVWGSRQNTYLAGAAAKAKIGPDSNITKRNAATSRLADILGIGDMVVKSSMVKMDIDGQKKYGLLMDKAKGRDMMKIDIENRKKGGAVEYTETSYRQLINLQIFDTICAQVDRNLGNYMVISEGRKNKKIEKITAIDNDLSFGNLKFKDVAPKGTNSYFNMSKITDKDGALGLPAVDAEFAEKILALTEEQIRYQMADLLENDELDALVDRIKGVQGLFQKAKDKKPGTFISATDKKAWRQAMDNFNDKLRDMDGEDALNEVKNFTYFSPLAFARSRKFYTENVRE